MRKLKVGIVGSGGIGLAYAAWISHQGHEVAIWSPRGSNTNELQNGILKSTGILEETLSISCANNAQALVEDADIIFIAVPVNGHRTVMDALLPHLMSGQQIIVSSMASLSSLYLYERACLRGINISVASFGTTALTARRKSPNHVHIMTKRPSLGVSCLPRSNSQIALVVCETLFGSEFTVDENPLYSTLTNTNAVSHSPLAIFNWTRIERGEDWPQYHFMTPHVAAVIEKLDAERLAVASAFGWNLRNIKQKYSKSFNVEGDRLADMAAELHKKRGGPPGPVDVKTRFLSEDVPFGLVFTLALGRMVDVSMPATEATIAMAGFIVGENFIETNDLIDSLRLPSETTEGLLRRVNID
ncbi:NAD/NADP octopine/nopaline dehydrogenase family protein [Pseudomonas sp. Pseusp16]|jgi:opine dehydrogenase|uniref:NAD/NADP octopine/nopaline dehydrogenase family protein n=1 Tax=Pseudomonas sp. Pseusp16 TaxID=3243021 RepID=UPI0039B479D9